MKMNKIIAGFLLFAGIGVLFQSCTKEVPTGKRNYVEQHSIEDYKDKAVEWANKVPEIHVYDKKNNRVITVNMQEKDFSFSDPNDGWNFSNSDEVGWSNNPNGGGILFVGNGAFGSNTGGVVIAGNSALDINYTFCFAASDEALGLDLFDFGGNFDGVSVVLGIAGDFDALAEGDLDEDAEFTDFFQGYAMYIVYDNEASGSYEVLNWFQDLDQDEDYLADHAFGFVLDFIEPGVYFTYDGTMTVSGGEMNYNGEYFGLFDFFLNFDEEGDEFDPEYGIVFGYGAMGCS